MLLLMLLLLMLLLLMVVLRMRRWYILLPNVAQKLVQPALVLLENLRQSSEPRGVELLVDAVNLALEHFILPAP